MKQEEITSLVSRVESCEKQNREMTAVKEANNAQMQTLSEKNKSLTNNAAGLKQENEAAQAQISQLSIKVAERTQERDQNWTEKEKISSYSLYDLQCLQSTRSNLETFLKHNVKLQEQLERTEEALKDIERLQAAQSPELESTELHETEKLDKSALKRENENLKSRLKDTETECSHFAQKHENLKEKLANANSTCASLVEQNRTLCQNADQLKQVIAKKQTEIEQNELEICDLKKKLEATELSLEAVRSDSAVDKTNLRKTWDRTEEFGSFQFVVKNTVDETDSEPTSISSKQIYSKEMLDIEEKTTLKKREETIDELLSEIVYLKNELEFFTSTLQQKGQFLLLRNLLSGSGPVTNVEQMRNEISELSAKLETQEAEVTKFQSLNSRVEKQNVILSDQVDLLNNEKQKQMEGNQRLSSQLEELESERRAMAEKVSTLTLQKESLNEEVEDLKWVLEKYLAENEQKRTENRELKEELEKLRAQLSAAERADEGMANNNDSSDSGSNGAQILSGSENILVDIQLQPLEDLHAKLKELTDELQNKEELLVEQRDMVNHFTSELKNVQQELAETQHILREKEEILDQQQAKVRDLEQATRGHLEAFTQTTEELQHQLDHKSEDQTLSQADACSSHSTKDEEHMQFSDLDSPATLKGEHTSAFCNSALGSKPSDSKLVQTDDCEPLSSQEENEVVSTSPNRYWSAAKSITKGLVCVGALTLSASLGFVVGGLASQACNPGCDIGFGDMFGLRDKYCLIF